MRDLTANLLSTVPGETLLNRSIKKNNEWHWYLHCLVIKNWFPPYFWWGPTFAFEASGDTMGVTSPIGALPSSPDGIVGKRDMKGNFGGWVSPEQPLMLATQFIFFKKLPFGDGWNPTHKNSDFGDGVWNWVYHIVVKRGDPSKSLKRMYLDDYLGRLSNLHEM